MGQRDRRGEVIARRCVFFLQGKNSYSDFCGQVALIPRENVYIIVRLECTCPSFFGDGESTCD
jgi:hypothetical protein